jgi:hypothetical protein
MPIMLKLQTKKNDSRIADLTVFGHLTFLWKECISEGITYSVTCEVPYRSS